MADYFSEVQAAVPTDTFEMFNITPEGVIPDMSVIQALDSWVAGQGEEPDLNKMWPSGTLDPGIALGTVGAIGEKYGDNKDVSDWVQKQKYSLGKSIPGNDPKAKGRMGTMWTSGFYKGQQTAIKNQLEGGAGGQQQPTPQPTQGPTQGPTPQQGQEPDLIAKLAELPIEEIQLYLEVGRITEAQFKEALALKGAAQ